MLRVENCIFIRPLASGLINEVVTGIKVCFLLCKMRVIDNFNRLLRFVLLVFLSDCNVNNQT